MLQIVFNKISAAEMAQIDTMEQLELLSDFAVTQKTIEEISGETFGKIQRKGKTLYRYRSKDWRVYFEVKDSKVIVHRVLHKNSLSDFLFRSKLPLSEDEELSQSPSFWKLIEEGESAGEAS